MRVVPINSNKKFSTFNIGKQAEMLNKLSQNSYPVVEGIVLTSQIFKEFIILGGIKEQVFSLYKAKKFDELRHLITNHEFPEELKEEIKHSCSKLGETYNLTASSMFQSDIGFYNIKKEQLLDWIKKCWASVFNEQNRNLDRKNMFPAVVVQRYMDIIKSGNFYTINPVMRDKSKLIVEVTTPKKYFFVIAKKDLKVINEREFRSVDSPLFIDEMDNLIKLGMSVEKSFKRPQRITWIFNEKFYITGTRRIDNEDLNYFQKLKSVIDSKIEAT